MGRKGKAQNHTAKEINAKIAAAKHAAGGAGGGSVAAANRLAATQKTQIPCKICLITQPTPTCMKTHYEAKHIKVNYAEDEAFYEAQHAANKRMIAEMDTGKTPKTKNADGNMTKKERETMELQERRAKEAKEAEREAKKKERMADALLTDEQRGVKQIKKGDALAEAGDLETALTVYKGALAIFGGKRPKLEQKIGETVAALAAEEAAAAQAADEPEPGVDESVEAGGAAVDQSVEADDEC
jgi:hypothetical protein